MHKILAIDDKQDNLVTLSALLKNLMPDCVMITAQSGMEGIAKAKAELPDAILLDVKMPEMDGFEACRRLMDDESTKHIPVIMITAIKTDAESRIEGLDCGANAFLAKPIDQYELVSQVKVALRIKEAEDALREERNSLERIVEERTMSLREEITARKQAEIVFKQTNIFLDSIIENIPNMVFLKDAKDLRFARFNRAGEDLLGYSRDNLLGKNDYDLFPKEQADHFTKKDREVLNGKEIVDIPEEALQTRSKGERTIHTKKVPLLDEKGEPEFLLGISEDITERKRVEKELAQSHDLLANLARLVPGVVYQYRLYPDGRSDFPYSSPGMNDIYEVTPEDVREDATPVFGRLHPDDYDHIVDSIQESARTLQTFYCEFRVILPRQGLRWRWSQAQPERLADGGTLWHGIISDITERKQAEEHLKETLEKLRKSLAGTIHALSSTVETRDPYTAGHQRKVSNLARTIAQEMGLSNDTVDTIRMAGIIHDIGKISVPAEILVKPGKISDVEFNLIKAHSQTGYDILKDVGLPYPIAEVAYQHHERLDGSGYPQGLKGDKILLEAKIISVADVVEAIASFRPYRPGFGIDVALEEIEKNKGILYDEKVVDTCLKLFREKGFAFE